MIDKKYQNKGIGNLFKKEKDKFCAQISGMGCVYSILGANVTASIKIKEAHGYSRWGMRYFYGLKEPNQAGEGHLVVMGKVLGNPPSRKHFPLLSKETQRLVLSCWQDVVFEGYYDRKVIPSSRYIISHKDETRFGQHAYHVQPAKENISDSLGNVVKSLLKAKGAPYIAIRIRADGLSTSVDSFLIEKGFHPTSYLPYFDQGLEVLEYQYVREINKKFTYDSIEKNE